MAASELRRLQLAHRLASLGVERAEAILAGDARSLEEVDVRYAKAAVDAAQVEVEQAREANRRHPGTVPASELRRMELVLELALLDAQRAEAVLAGDDEAL